MPTVGGADLCRETAAAAAITRLSLALEFLVHAANGTPNLKNGFWISCAITALASLFNWYVMRRGTLITGRESQSLIQDMRHLPRLVLDFILAGPLAVWRLFKPVKPTMN